jgi:hypothetical protein
MRGPGTGHAHPEGGSMKTLHRQSGVTLIEAAVVMCIITALTVSVMGTQMLIRRATAKRLVAEMIEVQQILYAFRDRYGMTPGSRDVPRVLPGAVEGWSMGGQIDDMGFDSWAGNEEVTDYNGSVLFWQHARLAGLAIGDPAKGFALNAVGGRLGITSSKELPTRPNEAQGLYSVCSGKIDAQLAKIMDTQIDDGFADSGNFWASPEYAYWPVTSARPTQPYDTDGSATYTVCMAF